MARHVPLIRDAGPEDVAALLDLWTQAGRGIEHTTRSQEDAATAVAMMAADPDQRMVLAECQGEVVAAMQVSRSPISPLHVESAMHTSFLLVRPDHRRHGHAHALLEAALVWAEEKDIHQMTAITDANSRDTNRFFARLGLSTFAVVRFSSTAALRKRLSQERGGANRHLGQVLAARRSMRRRQAADQD